LTPVESRTVGMPEEGQGFGTEEEGQGHFLTDQVYLELLLGVGLGSGLPPSSAIS